MKLFYKGKNNQEAVLIIQYLFLWAKWYIEIGRSCLQQNSLEEHNLSVSLSCRPKYSHLGHLDSYTGVSQSTLTCRPLSTSGQWKYNQRVFAFLILTNFPNFTDKTDSTDSINKLPVNCIAWRNRNRHQSSIIFSPFAAQLFYSLKYLKAQIPWEPHNHLLYLFCIN